MCILKLHHFPFVKIFINLFSISLKIFWLSWNWGLKTYVLLEAKRWILTQWKKHGHSFIAKNLFSVEDKTCTPWEIDWIAADRGTAIVVTLGRCFKPPPINAFICRAIEVKRPWSPETKAALKTDTSRGTHPTRYRGAWRPSRLYSESQPEGCCYGSQCGYYRFLGCDCCVRHE